MKSIIITRDGGRGEFALYRHLPHSWRNLIPETFSFSNEHFNQFRSTNIFVDVNMEGGAS
jgi:hypothetical protein